MEKNTIIAVVLAVVVIIGGMLVQSVFFPVETPPAEEVLRRDLPEPRVIEEPAREPEEAPPPGPTVGEPAVVKPDPSVTVQVPDREETVSIETEVFIARFSNRGGELTSLQLKDYRNPDGSLVEMVYNRDSRVYPFSIRFGDHNARAVDALFNHERSLTGTGVNFFRTFTAPSGIPFTLRKSFVFQPDSYMIELRVTIENSINEYPDLYADGYAYTLGLEPQIGPPFAKLDRRHEFRNYMYFAEGRKRDVRAPKEGVTTIADRVTWVALAGKYFQVIAVPDVTPYMMVVDTRPIPGLDERSSLYFSRPEIRSSRNTDVFRFYVGPKKRDVLTRFNDPTRNAYGLSNLRFEESLPSSPIIGWLASVLKFFLELFYRVVPNYGVAILLLTVLIKMILFPLTQKSRESTARMQALQPRMNELREKYKSNPQKMNQEIQAMYRKEGVSPLGGCLPMLLQLPIFFALFNLLSTHFELRSAVFIPGWINDLSSPESVLDFAPVQLLFFELSAIRVLPFVMLVTTFIQSRFTQPPDSSAAANMKLMTYAMPIVFFFILYDMPSGLVLYWTMQNVLSVFEQMYANSKRAKQAAAQPPAPPARAGGGKRPPGGRKPPKRRK